MLGFYTIFRATDKLVPTVRGRRVGDEGKAVGESPSALASRRAHFLFIGLSIEAVLLCIWEFSYSDMFRNNIYRFKVAFQLGQIILDLLTSRIMGDRLQAAPLLVSIQMAEMLVTVGARNFTEFSLCYLLEVGLNCAQRLFLYPFVKAVITLSPRWKLMAAEKLGRARGLTREERADWETKYRKVNEEIELRMEGADPLLDSLAFYSVEKTGSIVLPIMCFLLMLVYHESEMGLRYNIDQHELLYYAMFSMCMIPWMSLVDACILGSQELLYGWRVYDYFSYQRWRFSNRSRKWNLTSTVDESVSPSLQGFDLLCFSSQHYFILSIIALGFGTSMLGVTICLRQRYNLLGDPVFLVIVPVVVVCCEAIAAVCNFVSNTTVDAVSWNGIWKVSQLQGAMDDVVASRLAVGEGRQEDLEQERQELEALNSDAFRHKFIEKNTPWILQHLFDLITPQILDDPGPDGRPLVEYIRETYSNLMRTGQGTQRIDERSDISTDASEEDEDGRRDWDRAPPEGTNLTMAQRWLHSARKRMQFSKSIESLVEKKKLEHCSSCSVSWNSCKFLTAGLANASGEYDPYSIDYLIRHFESSYSDEETDLTLWKSFFRNQARYATICNVCLDKVEQKARKRNVVYPGEGVVATRPGDISSDDSDDESKGFDALIILRSSDEGQMLKKWLNAAKTRAGGDTVSEAISRAQTEAYVDLLSERSGGSNIQLKSKTAGETFKHYNSIDLDKVQEGMAMTWLTSARTKISDRFEHESAEIRHTLGMLLSKMEHHNLSDLRIEGKALKLEGDAILKKKGERADAVASQVQRLTSDFDALSAGNKERREAKAETLETDLNKLRRDLKRSRERREMEVERQADRLQSDEDIKVLRSSASSEIVRLNSDASSREKELMSKFADECKVLDRELFDLESTLRRDCVSLHKRSKKQNTEDESNWRKTVQIFVSVAKRQLDKYSK